MLSCVWVRTGSLKLAELKVLLCMLLQDILFNTWTAFLDISFQLKTIQSQSIYLINTFYCVTMGLLQINCHSQVSKTFW